MTSNKTASLADVVMILLTNGSLRRRYKTVNRTQPSVQNITHHGWIHIVMVWAMARVFGPLLGLKRRENLDEQAVVELACLCHDIGLSRGRRYHAINGAAMVESILAPLGVSDYVIKIVRLLVRFHRAEDFVWLTSEILPRWEFILAQLDQGASLHDLVRENNPEEDPSQDEVYEFLELMEQSVRMDIMLAAGVMIPDLGDIGRSRVRAKRRRVFKAARKISTQIQGVTVEDILDQDQIEYSKFDLANYAVISLSLILQAADERTLLNLLVQAPKAGGSNTNREETWQGLVAWAKQFSRLTNKDERLRALTQAPSYVTMSPAASEEPPARLVLRGVYDSEVCSPGRVGQIKSTYLAALVAAARCLGLDPILQWSFSLDY